MFLSTAGRNDITFIHRRNTLKPRHATSSHVTSRHTTLKPAHPPRIVLHANKNPANIKKVATPNFPYFDLFLVFFPREGYVFWYNLPELSLTTHYIKNWAEFTREDLSGQEKKDKEKLTRPKREKHEEFRKTRKCSSTLPKFSHFRHQTTFIFPLNA